ncbi:hypothetical protein GOP47_0000188 [Adiantum capillus-veneris]|uniref:Transcription initiation factor TFIID subunit 10 n=1 Tax=Adiantum capillus-veneris TaxID=13818 RepID=A0A9D4VDG3_ADICA|nr:hypothetical protein GOP47_0000188 [Adiantum capillus-veneris]
MEGRGEQDASLLVDFLSSVLDYLPVIPDELAEYYLNRSGFQCPDLRVKRLISIATQKFISEIVNDAFQLCKLKHTAPMREKKDKHSKEKRYVLTTEDLTFALREYGINIKRQDYYTESPVEGASSASKEKPDE